MAPAVGPSDTGTEVATAAPPHAEDSQPAVEEDITASEDIVTYAVGVDAASSESEELESEVIIADSELMVLVGQPMEPQPSCAICVVIAGAA